MRTILALDPGGTTGWARARIRDDGKIDWLQGMLGPQEHHNELWTLLEVEATQGFTIVCEAFDYRNDSRAGLELISREYIGVAKLFARQRAQTTNPVVLQKASQGKIRSAKTEASALVKKRNLVQLGLWNLGPGSVHHMVDATGHLLYYMLTVKNVIPSEMRLELLKRGGWK